jgi:DNA ligase-associated metallophosphoesterase
LSTLQINGNQLHLLPEKAIYWVEESALILSDVHLGKSGHFRKNGIAIPAMANQNNHWRMVEVIEKTNPKTLVFLGDLSHSEENSEWDDFVDFMMQFPEMRKILVKGNHDILSEKRYLDCGIEVVDSWRKNGLRWEHEHIDDGDDDYQISGHIHPGIRLKGGAKQSLVLPCFYFSKKNAIIPAFGEFTGLAILKPKREDRIWVIADRKVQEINLSI